MADSDGIAKLVDLTKDIKITMFTTIDAEGHFVSRPMAQHLVEPDGDLWFFARAGLPSGRADHGQPAHRADAELQRHLDLHRRRGRGGRGPGEGQVACGTAGWKPGCRKVRTTRTSS